MPMSKKTKQFDCVVCGTCTADMLVRPVPLNIPVGAGRLFDVEPVLATTGGIVANSGIAMSRLGLRVAALSLVGHDPWGTLVRENLARENVDANHVVFHDSSPTSTTAVLIDPSGERSFAHNVGACENIDIEFLRNHLSLFASSEVLLLGYYSLLPGLDSHLAEAIEMIRSTGCRVILESGGSGGDMNFLMPALPFIDVYVPSLDEARHQTQLDDPFQIIERFRTLGAPGLVGIKLGSRGSLLSPHPGEFLEIPCLPAPGNVADTTGAGDAFLAGLITGLVREITPGNCGLLGAAAAACCVTGVGATAGLRTLEATASLAGLVMH